MMDVVKMVNRPSREDILECYRLFMAREPESEIAVDKHLLGNSTLWETIRAFARSPEAVRCKIDEACRELWSIQDGRGIEAQTTPDTMVDMYRHISEIWSKYGKEDAYFSVLTNPAYHNDQLTEKTKEEFYRTGITDAEALQTVCRRNGLVLSASQRVLELGCGVGRIGEHFARAFKEYIGVDISSEHLAIARARFGQLGLSNASLNLLSEELKGERRFDVFYSMIVLQHNPPPIMVKLLDSFLSRLTPGGVAFFQVPCYLYDYTFDAAEYLQGRGMLNGMEMHALPQRFIFELLRTHDLTPVEVAPYPRIGPIGFSYSFLARKS